MDYVDLERLGLNKNEAKVYYALLLKGKATAQELVKSLGVYRNIVYDNLEKLLKKGLISFVVDGTKRTFIAEKPSAVVDFLEAKQEEINQEIKQAKKLIPQISDLIGSLTSKQDVTLFRGIAGLKKVLSEIVQAEKSWCIGITNESVNLLGETYWKNYNVKKKETKTNEWLLWNHDFKNTVIGKNKRSTHRALPKELNQVTETIMYDDKVAIMVYSAEPIVIVIDNKEIFETYKKHFDFLWKLSEDV
ncbi:MAG: helix-turn-helix domain-containing protein [archaeon]